MKKLFIFILCSVFSTFSFAQTELIQTFRPEPEGEVQGPCRCPGSQTPLIAGLEWKLATCRSGCTRGIGFRCGKQGYIICSGGAVVLCIWGQNCPNEETSRTMRANYTFYDDNTLKLTFLNVVPDSDAGNTVFEVEEDELMPLPSILLLNDVHYSGYRVSAGNYTIDYEDGEFGSVILSIELVE